MVHTRPTETSAAAREKSHQPQLVDGSYRPTETSAPAGENPTNRSWWMVHTRPTETSAAARDSLSLIGLLLL